MLGNAAAVETMLEPALGRSDHAILQSSSLALEPTQTSAASARSSLAAARRAGRSASRSASLPNAAPPLRARLSLQAIATRCAAAEVVAMLAQARLVTGGIDMSQNEGGSRTGKHGEKPGG